MFLTPLNTIYAQTANNPISHQEGNDVLSAEKKNFNYLEGTPGDNYLVYTYESDGSTYKVIENASENFAEINSTIYVKDENGEFIEFATQNLTVSDSEFIHTTNINGEVTIERQDLSVEQSDMISKEADTPLRLEPMSMGSCYGEPLSGWGYVNTVNSSTRINNWTITAVTAAVIYGATTGATNIASGALPTAAGAIAQKVVDELIPVLYNKRWYYELKLQNPGRGQENFIVGSNWYSNSARTNFIRATDAYVYHSCYQP